MCETLASIVCIGIASGCGAEAPVKRDLQPAIVLIVADALRADHLSVYGYDRQTSPAVDRLAEEGARFLTAMTPSSSALPSIVSLHTALPPEQHNVVRPDQALGEGALTLAEILENDGFETAAFVAGPGYSEARGLSQGFQTYVELTEDETNPDSSALTTRVMMHAIQFLASWRESNRPNPYFLYVQLAPLDGADLEQYDQSIRATDREIGHLLEELEKLEPRSNTLVIVTSTRGREFGSVDHGAIGHSLRNESVHVPLIMRLPARIQAGTVIPQRARLMDVGSTVLMFARVGLPPDFGFTHEALAFSMRDLAEMLVGEARDFDVVVTGDLAGRSQSFRQDDYKLVRHLPNLQGSRVTTEYELFDLAADPEEQRDIAQKEHKRAKQLADKLMAWREICARRPSYAVPYREESP